MWIATAAECREMDRQAEAMGISVESLMHEAGRAVAACVIENFPEAKKIAVVCGKGNNGGDGFVSARLLAERQIEVQVVVAAPVDELNPHAARECRRLGEVGVRPRFDLGQIEKIENVDLIVDAVLGTGAGGAPQLLPRRAIEAIVASSKPVVAVDIPSGVECDTGATPGVAVSADHTVTFGLAKPFLFQPPGMGLCGRWSVAPIGFPPELLAAPRQARLFSAGEAQALLPARTKLAHKGSEGHVAIVAGQHQMPGAAVLCALAALRAGAGLVTVAGIDSVCQTVANHLPEAILVRLPDESGVLSRESTASLVELIRRCDSFALGPGIGTAPTTKDLVHSLLETISTPCVLDADALNLVASGAPLPSGPSVLTPHPGEAGRLLGTDAAQVQANRFDSVRQLAASTGKTVLLKGAHTLITKPDSLLFVNPSGNPGMAAPGMGDVLTGIIAALLAKGLDPLHSAALGAFWHGIAGDLCECELGPAGFFASELAGMLPRTRATIAST